MLIVFRKNTYDENVFLVFAVCRTVYFVLFAFNIDFYRYPADDDVSTPLNRMFKTRVGAVVVARKKRHRTTTAFYTHSDDDRRNSRPGRLLENVRNTQLLFRPTVTGDSSDTPRLVRQ